jgi:hypothetical protein
MSFCQTKSTAITPKWTVPPPPAPPHFLPLLALQHKISSYYPLRAPKHPCRLPTPSTSPLFHLPPSIHPQPPLSFVFTPQHPTRYLSYKQPQPLSRPCKRSSPQGKFFPKHEEHIQYHVVPRKECDQKV